MGTIKVAILEKDSVEYDTLVEHDLAGALTHIGVSANDNFSYEKIITGATIVIPVNQQMLVHKRITFEETGELTIDGSLVILE